MGSISQDIFLSPLSLSLSLNRTVTMSFLSRLPLLLAIIFLGLFCLPHTNICSATVPDPQCQVYEDTDSARRLCKKATDTFNRNCKKDGKLCAAKCDSTGTLVVKD